MPLFAHEKQMERDAQMIKRIEKTYEALIRQARFERNDERADELEEELRAIQCKF